jgi:drug/metabolite transporter superfamily protein YnfA
MCAICSPPLHSTSLPYVCISSGKNEDKRDAAYGCVFVILSVLWGWGIDKKNPDLYDWIEALIYMIGVAVILWAPRHS